MLKEDYKFRIKGFKMLQMTLIWRNVVSLHRLKEGRLNRSSQPPGTSDDHCRFGIFGHLNCFQCLHAQVPKQFKRSEMVRNTGSTYDKPRFIMGKFTPATFGSRSFRIFFPRPKQAEDLQDILLCQMTLACRRYRLNAASLTHIRH